MVKVGKFDEVKVKEIIIYFNFKIVFDLLDKVVEKVSK